MKKTYYILTIAFLLMLNSCGGNNSHFESDNGSVALPTNVSIAQCNTDDLSQYTPLQSGDIVSKEQNDTIVTIVHNQDNQKFVCITQGSATITRIGE